MWLTNVDPYILNLIHNWKVEYRTHEMAQVIERLTHKPDHFCVIPGSHKMKGQRQVTQAVL